eukprot:TRINITY_DN1039_c0_g1_i1.p1 TRINITY_DN1039_c0_g1~~TRINITY_DN1039_c0_g1_i1.p1  ORF type:complete len:504 (+),score=104.61 TRINITY_DN1039_c0_g1_i1:109-1620(+)
MTTTLQLLNIIITFLLITTIVDSQKSCHVSNTSKIDCGYVGINENLCVAKGCCWYAIQPNPDGYPWCYYDSSEDECERIILNVSGVPFDEDELAVMRKYFLQNINIDGKGGVVASPDTNVNGGGSYYFHWERDGALSMNALWRIRRDVPDAEMLMKKYVEWVLTVQGRSDPNGIDVRVEPKYTLPDGNVFTGGWCRPQTDGPSLRAITLTVFADYLIENGQIDYVTKFLWRNDTQLNGGAIKYDLDWVVKNWEQDGCDLWEEIHSNDFFWNRFSFRKSLIVGSKLAKKMGDTALSNTFDTVASKIESTLSSHWNGEFVLETSIRQKDGAVICAFNDGYTDDEYYFPTSKEVASTIKNYNSLFCSEYKINRDDTKQGIPGIMYGRYKGDHYGGGNPWILSTAALAELFYRGSHYTIQNGLPDSDAMTIWKEVLSLPDKTITKEQLSQALRSAGDSVLLRIRHHVKDSGFHLSEQIDRNTGVEVSATDLTWSYATVLKAMKARGN